MGTASTKCSRAAYSSYIAGDPPQISAHHHRKFQPDVRAHPVLAP